MAKEKEKSLFIAKTFVNSFHYLSQDAEFFRGLAAKEQGASDLHLSAGARACAMPTRRHVCPLGETKTSGWSLNGEKDASLPESICAALAGEVKIGRLGGLGEFTIVEAEERD